MPPRSRNNTNNNEQKESIVDLVFEKSEAPAKGGNRDATQVVFDEKVAESHAANEWFKIKAPDEKTKADFEKRLRKAASDNGRGVSIRTTQETDGSYTIRFLGKDKRQVNRG